MSNKVNKKRFILSGSKGFTLIEVVLVLAIGGLIFLLAFLAFRNASVNRRDTQRRNDAGRIISEIQNASGDRGGATLFLNQNTLNNFIGTYLGGGTPSNQFKSNNITYTVRYGTNIPARATGAGVANVSVAPGQRCSDSGLAMTASPGNYAVLVGLEKGVACRDDN